MPPVVTGTVTGRAGGYVTVRLDEGCPGCGMRHVHVLPAGAHSFVVRPGCLAGVREYIVEVQRP